MAGPVGVDRGSLTGRGWHDFEEVSRHRKDVIYAVGRGEKRLLCDPASEFRLGERRKGGEGNKWDETKTKKEKSAHEAYLDTHQGSVLIGHM